MNTRKNYLLLIEEFKNELGKSNYISNLTGLILYDPILIPGSSEFIEREFVAQCIKESGRNPFTRQLMTIVDLAKISTDTKAKEAIDHSIEKFISVNSEHPDIAKIKLAVYEERYLPDASPATAVSNAEQGPTDPTPDDLLAMADGTTQLQELDDSIRTITHSLPHSFYINIDEISMPDRNSRTIHLNGLDDDASTRHFAIRHRSFFDRDRNREMRETISLLQIYGVTEELIRQHWQPATHGACWTGHHKFALIYLVTGQSNRHLAFLPSLPQTPVLPVESRLSPIEALQEMTDLCHNRVGILVKFYLHGIRGAHLRTLHGDYPILLDGHCFALEYLLRQGLPFQDAIEQVNDMTKDETWRIDERVARRMDFDMH